MALHPILRRFYDFVYNAATTSPSIPLSDCVSPANSARANSAPATLLADGRKNQRISFDVCFSLLFLLALHGFSAPKVLLILYINYTLAKRLRIEYVPQATWIFNIGILFANELGKGYPYSDIANIMTLWQNSEQVSVQQDSKTNWGTVLDSYGGLSPRWEILFNVTVLRMISFNLDYVWSLNRGAISPVEVRKCRIEHQDRFVLTATRRNNWILQIYQRGTGSTYQPNLMTTLSATTSPILYTRLSILQGQS